MVTSSFTFVAGLNEMVHFAGTATGTPVWGLRLVRAFCCLSLKVPSVGTLNRPSSLMPSSMVLKAASTMALSDFLVILGSMLRVSAANLSTNCCLFMLNSLLKLV